MTMEAHMTKTLHCGDVIDGCDSVLHGSDEAAVLAQAALHAREDHGYTDLDDETVDAVRAAIRTE